MTLKRKRFLFRAVLSLAGVFLIASALTLRVSVKEPKRWGVTFSAPYMERFGIPWKTAYDAVLNDLGARTIRIPVYWSMIEKEKGVYDFADIDYQMKRAREAGATIILAVGRKVPRWPECHEPAWVKTMPIRDQQTNLLSYVETVMRRYKDSPALEAWQIENEPFLAFGDCPKLDVAFLDSELALARRVDPGRPIIVSDSGELSLWIRAARRADIFGTTLYRTIYNKRIGYFTYPLPPSFFRLKRSLAELAVGKKPMIVIELQAESWGPNLTYTMTKEEQYISFNPAKFKDTIEYATQSGFDTFYLWGVEWWYWLKEKQNDPALWNIAKKLFGGV